MKRLFTLLLIILGSQVSNAQGCYCPSPVSNVDRLLNDNQNTGYDLRNARQIPQYQQQYQPQQQSTFPPQYNNQVGEFSNF